MRCAFCHSAMAYVHGHAACIESRCPMFGVNQAECCSGEYGSCVPTSSIARAPGGEPGAVPPKSPPR